MKKICLLGVAMITGMAAMAQESLVKDVEHQLKGATPDYVSAFNAIQPALTNDETKDDVKTWLTAGKAAFGCYDKIYDAKALNMQPSDAEVSQGAKALAEGYAYYLKALQLDSVPDAKGKVKAKESKNILKKIAAYYPNLRTAGGWLFDMGDVDNSFDIWELYLNLPDMPEVSKANIVPDPDYAMIRFFQGACKLQNSDFAVALSKFKEALSKGFDSNIHLYTWGALAADRLGDEETLYEFAKAGYDKFGTEDVQIVGQLINYYLNKKDYDQAMAVIDDGIANTAEDNTSMHAQLWNIKGYILECNEKTPDATVCYAKAVELDPTFAKGYFDLARMHYNKAQFLRQESQDEVTPEIEETELLAADLFKKAYELDQMVGDGKVPGILWHIYYGLGEKYVNDAEDWKALQ